MGTDYRREAVDYALREVTGTDLLAFREVSRRIAELRLSGAALDVGCGAGRSTRFLKSHGFEVVGVDASDSMLREARKRDPQGDYRCCGSGGSLPLPDSAFDLVLSTWVVLEIESRETLNRLFKETARTLKRRGVAFVVANTAEFYSGRWTSCEVDFPENTPPLQSGQRVKARLLPEGVVVTDTFWTDADYREAIRSGGLRISNGLKPLAPTTEPGWLDETKVAPWIVYECVRPE